MILRLVPILWILFVAAGSTWAADCDVRLKPSDDFAALSEKLACLQARIEKLEAQVSRGGAPSAANLTRDLPKGATTAEAGGVVFTLEKCTRDSRRRGALVCEYGIVNTSTGDKRVCFGTESRLVTDTGGQFSRPYIAVGSENGMREVCDLVPPRVKSSGAITFSKAGESAESKIQFVRLDCGSGCTLDAYNVPVQ